MTFREETINKLEWTPYEAPCGKMWYTTEKVRVGDRVMFGLVEQQSAAGYGARVMCGLVEVRERKGKWWLDEQQAWCVNTLEALQTEQE